MDNPLKTPPAYAVTSVDHALRIVTMLQLEGPMTVAEVADRLKVARSTAHRLLAMLVYRDFAVQDASRAYRAGPALELTAYSPSDTARLRQAALPHLVRLVDRVGESANLAVRAGVTARFIAGVECSQLLRVGNREGMVFPAHVTTGGLLLLAELSDDELAALYSRPSVLAAPGAQPDLPQLRKELALVQRNGFALNNGRSERGVVAVGVPVRDPRSGRSLAGLAVCVPSVRYDRSQLPSLVARLAETARCLEADL